MSQLADIEDIVRTQPMEPDERARLFYELMQALGWEVDGVHSSADAQVYLFQMRE